jgi:hypothetical protein
MGPHWSEPRLIALAHSFEQAALAEPARSVRPCPPHVSTGAPPRLAESLAP